MDIWATVYKYIISTSVLVFQCLRFRLRLLLMKSYGSGSTRQEVTVPVPVLVSGFHNSAYSISYDPDTRIRRSELLIREVK
jgi:hypothetical protein